MHVPFNNGSYETHYYPDLLLGLEYGKVSADKTAEMGFPSETKRGVQSCRLGANINSQGDDELRRFNLKKRVMNFN